MVSIKEYKIWCKHHNLGTGLNKSRNQLQNEIDIINRSKATERLSSSKKDQNLRNIIQQLYSKKFSNPNNEISKEITKAFKDCNKPKILLEVFLNLESTSKLFRDASHIRGITELVMHYYSWIRSLQDWKPKTHNADRQFSSLARHLLATYEVPGFMDSAWLEGNRKQQKWFKHIGMGKNIRNADGLPISLTKKMAHFFSTAPNDYTVEAAFRWGQVHALGGDRRLADVLRETRIVRSFEYDDFWLSVVRFFVRNPMLDPSLVGPVVDYIWNQKYENRRVFDERGVAEERGPEQPNFSMKGRNPESLLRQVERWHRQLGKEAKGGNLQWPHSNFNEFEFKEGTKKTGNMKFWTIRELLSSKELIGEGRAMRHCVASYAQSCSHGGCSIWTMEVEDKSGQNKMLTIDVSQSNKIIRQVRGRNNRLPTVQEMGILQRWATKEGLRIASYLRTEN